MWSSTKNQNWLRILNNRDDCTVISCNYRIHWDWRTSYLLLHASIEERGNAAEEREGNEVPKHGSNGCGHIVRIDVYTNTEVDQHANSQPAQRTLNQAIKKINRNTASKSTIDWGILVKGRTWRIEQEKLDGSGVTWYGCSLVTHPRMAEAREAVVIAEASRRKAWLRLNSSWTM